MQTSWTIAIIGILLILEALFQPLLLKILQIPSPEELFTTPAFRKSARHTRRGFRLAAFFLGVSLIFYGTGGFGLSTPLPQVVEVFTFLCSWIILIVVLIIRMRAKPQ